MTSGFKKEGRRTQVWEPGWLDDWVPSDTKKRKRVGGVFGGKRWRFHFWTHRIWGVCRRSNEGEQWAIGYMFVWWVLFSFLLLSFPFPPYLFLLPMFPALYRGKFPQWMSPTERQPTSQYKILKGQILLSGSTNCGVQCSGQQGTS